MANRKPFQIDVDKFNASLYKESDRACAILGAAMLDARLESLFRSRLLGSADELLANGRPLGSFSVKIRLSHSLGWISDDAFKDLNIVREVRNRFAHSFDHDLTFDDQSIRDQCSNLRSIRSYFSGMEEARVALRKNVSDAVIDAMRDVLNPPRAAFQAAVDFLRQYLDNVPSNASEYSGPDLSREVYDLAANARIKISASATPDTAPTQQNGSPKEA